MRTKTNILVIVLLVASANVYLLPIIAADTTMPTSVVAVETSANPPAIGDSAPPISATDLKGQSVSLDQFHGTPIVLQFGSLTDPIFRMHCPSVEKLAATYDQKAKFILIYQHEAHPAGTSDDLEINTQEGFSAPAPANLDERIKLATQAATRLNITNQNILVDAWDDSTSHHYGSLANLTVLIDAKGKIAAIYPWMDSVKLDGALDDLLSGKPVAEAHRGPPRSTGAAITVQESTDIIGPAHFATVIDNLHLNDQQRQAVYPFLADYVGEIRTLREARAGKPAGAAATATTAPTTAPAVPQMTQAELLMKIVQTTDDFEAHLKPLLSDDQYAQLIQGLNRPFGGKNK